MMRQPESWFVLMMRRCLAWGHSGYRTTTHIVGTSGPEHPDGVVEADVVVANVDTQEVQHLTDDGQSIFVFLARRCACSGTCGKAIDILGGNQKAGHGC